MIDQLELNKAKIALNELKELIKDEEGELFDKYLDVDQIYNPLLDFYCIHMHKLFSKDFDSKRLAYKQIKDLPKYEKLKRKGQVHYEYLEGEANSIVSSFERIIKETEDFIINKLPKITL